MYFQPSACPPRLWPCIPIGGAWSQIAWWCCSTNILGSETPQNWNSISWAPDCRFYEAMRRFSIHWRSLADRRIEQTIDRKCRQRTVERIGLRDGRCRSCSVVQCHRTVRLVYASLHTIIIEPHLGNLKLKHGNIRFEMRDGYWTKNEGSKFIQ